MLMPSFLFEKDFFEFEQLFRERFPGTKRLKKGGIIIHLEDDRSKDCYYVLSGTASYVLKHEQGGTKMSSLRGQGTIFPLFYTFSSTNMERSLEVIALTDMEIIVIPKASLHQLMLEIPGIAIAMCDAYGKYTTLLLYDITSMIFESANSRVCNYLLIQTLVSGDIINMTHEEIGEVTGVTRATVSRIISKLRSKGIITTSRHEIRIISQEGLLSYCTYIATQSS